jgi:hypothetical protein
MKPMTTPPDPNRGYAANYPAIRSTGTIVSGTDALPTKLGFEPRLPRSSIGDDVLRLVLFDDLDVWESRGFRAYYGGNDVSDSDTILTFLDGAGVMLRESGTLGVGFDAIKNPNKQAVAIGPYSAAVVLQNPTPAGVRPYSLHWTDGIVDYEVLAGVLEPVSLIDFLRSMFCSAT